LLNCPFWYPNCECPQSTSQKLLLSSCYVYLLMLLKVLLKAFVFLVFNLLVMIIKTFTKTESCIQGHWLHYLVKPKIVKSFVESFFFFDILSIGTTIVKSFVKRFFLHGCWNFQGANSIEIVKSFGKWCNSCILCNYTLILSFVVKDFINYIICCFKLAKSFWSVSFGIYSFQPFLHRLH